MLIHAHNAESTLYDALQAARTARRNSQSESPVVLSYEMAHYILNIVISKSEFGVLSESATVVKLPASDLLDLSNNNKPWGVDTDVN